MKKPTSKIRQELARLQEQLKAAETRDAERIGRIALKAGLGEIEIEDADLQAAFEDLAKRFREGSGPVPSQANATQRGGGPAIGPQQNTSVISGAIARPAGEA